MTIEAKHVTAGYGASGPPVVRDVSFQIREGRRVCILGANGSGKTTLLRVLLGILPSEGQIRIDGQDLRQMKRRQIAEKIALMTQLPETYFSYTVRETVMQGRFLKGRGVLNLPRERDRQAVDQCLKETGLLPIADQTITTLSGGQRQRVFLARTLAQDTPCLFLDEPTNHLDLRYQAELAEHILDWSERDQSRTMLAVFHDISLALRIAQDVIVMKKGQVIGSGPALQVLTPRLLSETYEMDVADYMGAQWRQWRYLMGQEE